MAIEVRTEQAAPRQLAAIRSVTTPQDLRRTNWEVYGDPAEDPAQTRTDIYFLLEPAAG